jgi:hypothetical protein
MLEYQILGGYLYKVIGIYSIKHTLMIVEN